jgi:hypothetical protein
VCHFTEFPTNNLLYPLKHADTQPSPAVHNRSLWRGHASGERIDNHGESFLVRDITRIDISETAVRRDPGSRGSECNSVAPAWSLSTVQAEIALRRHTDGGALGGDMR